MARKRSAAKQTTTRKIRSNLPRKMRDIRSIRPYENNPRINEHAIEYVMNSIRDFGFTAPIVIDRHGVIINGHTRYEAMKRLGQENVECIEANHLTDAEAKAFRIADNKAGEMANWDFDKLTGEVGVLKDMGIDLTLYGYTVDEIDCMAGMVADDCLSAGVAAGLDESSKVARTAETRAPDRTRLVLGEFVFFIDSVAYKQWANEIRIEGDYNVSDISTILQDRLGITPYMESTS